MIMRSAFESLNALLCENYVPFTDDGCVGEKQDQSPVTKLDLQYNDLLHNYLEKLEPIPIVSEENSPPASHLSDYWLIDPLDGTKEYIQGLNEFCICVARVKAGRPVLGFLAAPAMSLWSFCSESEGVYHSVPFPHRSSAMASPRIAVSRFHKSQNDERFLELHPELHSVELGAATKFIAIAQDYVDVYPRFEGSSIWDTAAGQCLIETSGGLFLSYPDFKATSYDARKTRNTQFLALSAKAKCRRDDYIRSFLTVMEQK